LRHLDKDLESSSDASKYIEKDIEHEENIEELATRSPSTSTIPMNHIAPSFASKMATPKIQTTGQCPRKVSPSLSP
jgi:hypothetical protein